MTPKQRRRRIALLSAALAVPWFVAGLSAGAALVRELAQRDREAERSLMGRGNPRHVDWRTPPAIVHRADAPTVSPSPPDEIPQAAIDPRLSRPDPTRVIIEDVDPTPAEVIPVLEMLDILRGPGGAFGRVSAKVRKRELDRIAIAKIDAGEPFIYHGRRFPGTDG